MKTPTLVLAAILAMAVVGDSANMEKIVRQLRLLAEMPEEKRPSDVEQNYDVEEIGSQDSTFEAAEEDKEAANKELNYNVAGIGDNGSTFEGHSTDGFNQTKKAVPAFLAAAAKEIGGKVVSKLGDRIAEGVVENHQEKVVSGLQDYLGKQMDKFDDEYKDLLKDTSGLAAGLNRPVEEADIQLLPKAGATMGNMYAPPGWEIRHKYKYKDDSYDRNEVPDSMTVQGIYDTNVGSYTFSSTEEYRQYLAEKSAVTSAKAMFQEEINKASGHVAVGGLFGIGFSVGGGKSSQSGTSSQSSDSSASSSASAQLSEQHAQTYMAMLEINIFRYEIFMDDVTPDRLNVGFLRDFISLPESYFSPGAEIIFQNFYLRWGTHYIKSAKFGGQLKIIKTKQATKDLSMSEFATRAEADWKMTMSTFSALASQTKSSSWLDEDETKTESKEAKGQAASDSDSQANREQQKQASSQEYSNEVLEVQGGDQQIAAAITEMYTTALTTELKDWLESINDYPKPFSFVLRPVPDLLNIPFVTLFPAGDVDYGCFGKRDLKTEEGTGRKYYTHTTTKHVGDDNRAKNSSETVTVSEIRYCNFADRKALEDSMTKKRLSLGRAVTVYLEEGRLLSSDFLLPAGGAGCETAMLAFLQGDNTGVPTWEDMTGGKEFTVVFDMPSDIPGILQAQDVLELKFFRHKWFSTRRGFVPHLYDGYKNGGSNDLQEKKAMRLQTTQLNDNAGGLGSTTLYQSYFVCVTEDVDETNTVIQYGKTPDNEERPHVWLSFTFNELASLRYYSFGSGESPVKVMGLSLLDSPAKDFIICREGTEMINGVCQQKCHPECEGCRTSGSNSPMDCIACKHLKVPYPYKEGQIGAFQCVAQCPQHMEPFNVKKSCTCIKRMEETSPDGVVDCVTECPLTHFNENSVCKKEDGSFTCHQCQPGHECKHGDEREDICPAGKHSNENRSACELCAAGEFSGTPGAASCQKCPAGQTSNPGSSHCRRDASYLTSYKGWNYYKVPATGDMTSNKVKATCEAAGYVTPCSGDSACIFSSSSCFQTGLLDCYNPMKEVSQQLCGANFDGCPQMYDVYQFMNNWHGGAACGAQPIRRCADGNGQQDKYAFCAKDKHQYLLRNSSHPKHCKQGIPYGQFLRLRRICSSTPRFKEKAAEFRQHFQQRGYEEALLDDAITRAQERPREDTLKEKGPTPPQERTVLVTTYSPHLPPLQTIIRKYWHLLQLSTRTKDIFKDSPLFAYRRNKNIKDLLVRAQIPKEDKNFLKKFTPSGSFPCGRNKCSTCTHIKKINYFTSHRTGERHLIRKHINAKAETSSISSNARNAGYNMWARPNKRWPID
uniref:MACPF domain-containing protein n=1 Tax=Branchiostoma floridae TaxID=7739 RepID=C3Z0X4_BRAFL|eukprot:XP_002597866.1 hypothetical protein BRAFLDRAFT_105473 [Branchiostoma floridae]